MASPVVILCDAFVASEGMQCTLRAAVGGERIMTTTASLAIHCKYMPAAQGLWRIAVLYPVSVLRHCCGAAGAQQSCGRTGCRPLLWLSVDRCPDHGTVIRCGNGWVGCVVQQRKNTKAKAKSSKPALSITFRQWILETMPHQKWKEYADRFAKDADTEFDDEDEGVYW